VLRVLERYRPRQTTRGRGRVLRVLDRYRPIPTTRGGRGVKSLRVLQTDPDHTGGGWVLRVLDIVRLDIVRLDILRLGILSLGILSLDILSLDILRLRGLDVQTY